MPLSNTNYYQERVFTSVIGEEIDNNHDLTEAAHHVIDYDDPGALRWMADRVSENAEAVAGLPDSELQGAIEWYLRRGSSKDYGL